MNPFLVYHKANGKFVFDIAEQCDIAGEEAWITNFGYRVYPVWTIDLADVEDGVLLNATESFSSLLPTAIECFSASKTIEAKVTIDLEALGLIQVQPIQRRL